jgi:hypothetical protein
MTAQDIIVQELGTYDLSCDGTSLRVNFVCDDGSRRCVTVPTVYLGNLIMTLPQLMQRALQARHQDDSLRLVHRTDRICIEKSSDPKIIVLTLATPDGFEVSFGLSRQQIAIFEDAAKAIDGVNSDPMSPVLS